jgi:flavodoxin/Pyruvate/2-oxoacid:ferredoxin oxidoreductase delta subunit
VGTKIYYFSGTGNSLVVARNIAEKTKGTLIAIPSVMDKENIELDADVIGVVFSIYYATNECGIPLIVGRFVRKLENIGSKYIFAVCTCGHMSGSTIENLRKAIESRGGELAAGFTVKMSNKKLTEEKQKKMAIAQKKKVDTICEYVAARKKGKFETRDRLRKLVFAPLLFLAIKPVFSRRYRKLSNLSQHLPFSELIPLADRSFQIDEKCSGCGTCAKICPVNNIKIVDNRPVWQHHCETCFACYAWCPKEAIHSDILSYAERYYNPYVEISDVLKRN